MEGNKSEIAQCAVHTGLLQHNRDCGKQGFSLETFLVRLCYCVCACMSVCLRKYPSRPPAWGLTAECPFTGVPWVDRLSSQNVFLPYASRKQSSSVTQSHFFIYLFFFLHNCLCKARLISFFVAAHQHVCISFCFLSFFFFSFVLF